MPSDEASRIKERIVSVLRSKGPGFPSPIASEIKTSILFTSAFLSELLSDKIVKTTNMKVGSSPIYYLPGQESRLENFARQYLKSKEKDAFILLHEKKFLRDSEQEPAIRVALRAIKDFAFPVDKNKELYWKYFLISDSEPLQEKEKQKIPEEEISKEELIEIEIKKVEEKPLGIFEKEESKEIREEKIIKERHEKIHKEKPAKKTPVKKSPSKNKTAQKKNDENFFNKIKEYLAKKQIEIMDIINFSKGEAILKIKKSLGDEKEEMLFAFNQKKISEKEILKCFKKSLEYNLNYSILFLGETPKKISEMVSAVKNLSKIDKLDD